MPQEKIGSGVLMTNTYKQEGDSKPDLTGPVTVKVAGIEVEYEIAAWKKIATKEGKRLKVGDKYLSFQIQEKWKKDIPAADAVAATDDNVAF